MLCGKPEVNMLKGIEQCVPLENFKCVASRLEILGLPGGITPVFDPTTPFLPHIHPSLLFSSKLRTDK